MPMSRVRIRSTMSSISSWSARSFAIQVEVGDDLLEPRAAEDLLADRLQPILDARGHRRPDVALGHALRHDQDQRLGAVEVRQLVDDRRRHAANEQRRQHDQPLAPPRDLPQRRRTNTAYRGSLASPLLVIDGKHRSCNADRNDLPRHRAWHGSNVNASGGTS